MQGNITYDLPSTLTTFDLSNNNLTGNIPTILSDLSYFNISNNSFTGSIPKSLQYATTLDISHNYLSGCINFQFNGSSFYFNDNYLSGNLSFLAPSQLYLRNNRVNDVLISNAIGLSNCSLANNPMAPGVFGKTFKNQCNLNGIYTASQSTCRILALGEVLPRYVATSTTVSTLTNLASTTRNWPDSVESTINAPNTTHMEAERATTIIFSINESDMTQITRNLSFI
eukprot:NODE_567_length_5957_cov_0.651588.p3 type:complete len:227 gc:universal NODE_567_length_5957_cov_0.651588:1136-456(-)